MQQVVLLVRPSGISTSRSVYVFLVVTDSRSVPGFLASTLALVVTDSRLAPTLWDLSRKWHMSYKVGAKLFIKKGGKKRERKRESSSLLVHIVVFICFS
jgi:hypothetical protein